MKYDILKENINKNSDIEKIKEFNLCNLYIDYSQNKTELLKENNDIKTEFINKYGIDNFNKEIVEIIQFIIFHKQINNTDPSIYNKIEFEKSKNKPYEINDYLTLCQVILIDMEIKGNILYSRE